MLSLVPNIASSSVATAFIANASTWSSPVFDDIWPVAAVIVGIIVVGIVISAIVGGFENLFFMITHAFRGRSKFEE